ncbi:hypothetical protein ACFL6S_04745 [Candidatus Poribacteria bacterium]
MSGAGHLMWIVFGVVVGFVASFIFGDLLNLPPDLYYLIYFGIIIAFFTVYIKKTQLELKEWLVRRLFWGIILGLVFGAFMLQNVLSRPETERFAGPYLLWLIFWRGLVYGAIDGLLLSVFPWMVTWRAFGVRQKTLGKRIAFALLALFFVLVLTTAYHIGYSDFRSKKVIQADIGNTIISVPTLLSGNPLGATSAHMIMHVTAVTHSPKTGLFLPPHQE